jgi:hypothetical protein
MLDPRAGDLADPLVQFAVEAAASRRAHGLLVRLREHQGGLIGALDRAGFDLVDSQLLMVKQLAAPVLQRQLTPALEKAV